MKNQTAILMLNDFVSMRKKRIFEVGAGDP